jgi:putative sterol carrier protein
MTNHEGMPRHEVANYPSGKRCLPLAIKALAIAICMSAVSASAAEHMDSTPQAVFDSMRGSFQPAKAKGVHARYQWDLSGPQGGQWWIDVEDGKYKMGKGKIDNPSVTFIASAADWVAISNGKLNGTWAFMTGRLKVRGSQAVARKLNEIFP